MLMFQYTELVEIIIVLFWTLSYSLAKYLRDTVIHNHTLAMIYTII